MIFLYNLQLCMCRSVVRWQRCYSHPTSSARTVSRSVSLLGTFFTFFVPCRRGMHLPVQEFADEAVSIDGDDSLKDRPRGSILSFRRMAHVAKHKKSVLVLHKGHCVVFLSGSFLILANSECSDTQRNCSKDKPPFPPFPPRNFEPPSDARRTVVSKSV